MKAYQITNFVIYPIMTLFFAALLFAALAFPPPVTPTKAEMNQIKDGQNRINRSMAALNREMSQLSHSVEELEKGLGLLTDRVSAMEKCSRVEPLNHRELRTAAGLWSLCEEASKGEVDPYLILAVIVVESRLDPEAKSPAGAEGYMQIKPSVRLSMKEGHDPDPIRANIRAGSEYLLRMLFKYHGNLQLALAAYNAGPSKIKDEVPDIPETQCYVWRVLRSYRYLRGLNLDQIQLASATR